MFEASAIAVEIAIWTEITFRRVSIGFSLNVILEIVFLGDLF
jgi:hypothetical protein